jgi:arginine exporter protein ArgO
MTGAIVDGLWAGYGLAMPVGAVAVLMVSLTARTSFRIGASAAIGAASADAIYAVAAALGGGALATILEPFAGPLRWAASAILVAMAVRIAIIALRHRRESTAVAGDEKYRVTPGRAYLTYLALTALNPWPGMYFVALLLGRQAEGHVTLAHEVVYIAAIVSASASWQLLLAGGGTALGKILTSNRGRVATALVSSGVIIALAAKLVA